MELLRTALTPTGEEILAGIGWDLVWLVVWASAAFIAAHLVWTWRRRRAALGGDAAPEAGAAGAGAGAASAAGPAGLQGRILRHTGTARFLHWAMAAAALVLLLTTFVPVLGLSLPWVGLHWSAGLVLFFAVAWHIIHVLGWQDFWSMWITGRDVREGTVQLRHALSPRAPAAPRAGKYPVEGKLHHQGVALASVVVIATGLLMMVRVDTPLWPRDPELLSAHAWGWVYLAHGLSGVSLLGLVAAHIYCALRPERRWLTGSMVRGWITRDRYLTHHDPGRWPVPGISAPPPMGGAPADAPLQAPREDA